MARVFLINPPLLRARKRARPGGTIRPERAPRLAPGLHDEVLSPPLSLLYLAQVLRDGGHETAIWDGQVDALSEVAFQKRLQDYGPDIVGISVLTEFVASAREVAASARDCCPQATIVMGGPHATYCDTEIVADGVADVVVRGDGEDTMSELAAGIARGRSPRLAAIAGITYRDPSTPARCIRNPDRPRRADLDRLPVPDRGLLDLDRYRRRGVMVTSRGCPHGCLFCAASSLSGGGYRCRDPRAVVDEMLYLERELGVDHVFLCDDALTVIPARVAAICDLLKAEGFGGTWSASSRTDGVTEPTLARMATAGCTSVSFGVESGDQAVLDAIGKRIRLDDVVRAVRWAADAGMHVKCNFVIGHHADTPETIRATLDLAKALKREFGASTPLGINTPFPGTPLRARAAELGVTVLSDDWSDYTVDHCVIETAHLTCYEIQRWYFQGTLELASERPLARRLLAPFGASSATDAPARSRAAAAERDTTGGGRDVAADLVDLLMLTSCTSRENHTPWLAAPQTAEAGRC